MRWAENCYLQEWEGNLRINQIFVKNNSPSSSRGDGMMLMLTMIIERSFHFVNPTEENYLGNFSINHIVIVDEVFHLIFLNCSLWAISFVRIKVTNSLFEKCANVTSPVDEEALESSTLWGDLTSARRIERFELVLTSRTSVNLNKCFLRSQCNSPR